MFVDLNRRFESSLAAHVTEKNDKQIACKLHLSSECSLFSSYANSSDK